MNIAEMYNIVSSVLHCTYSFNKKKVISQWSLKLFKYNLDLENVSIIHEHVAIVFEPIIITSFLNKK